MNLGAQIGGRKMGEEEAGRCMRPAFAACLQFAHFHPPLKGGGRTARDGKERRGVLV